MARAELRHGDYSITLSDDEAHNLGLIKIDGNKVVGIPLRVDGSDQDGNPFVVDLQKIDFDDLGDGIRVIPGEDTIFVQINNNAWRRLQEQPLSGTRYNGQDKIHINVENSSTSPSQS